MAQQRLSCGGEQMLCIFRHGNLASVIVDVGALFGKDHLDLMLSQSGRPEHCTRKSPTWSFRKLVAPLRIMSCLDSLAQHRDSINSKGRYRMVSTLFK